MVIFVSKPEGQGRHFYWVTNEKTSLLLDAVCVWVTFKTVFRRLQSADAYGETTSHSANLFIAVTTFNIEAIHLVTILNLWFVIPFVFSSFKVDIRAVHNVFLQVWVSKIYLSGRETLDNPTVLSNVQLVFVRGQEPLLSKEPFLSTPPSKICLKLQNIFKF